MKRAEKDQRHIVPGSDLFKYAFDICDKFNVNINKHKFPHKCGGRGHKGERGQLHKFAMVVIIENVFAAFKEVNPVGSRSMSFCAMCEAIAIHLYMKSFAVPK